MKTPSRFQPVYNFLKASWLELCFQYAGAYVIVLGIVQPFISVVPSGRPEEMLRDQIFTIGTAIVGGGIMIAVGLWLRHTRRNKERAEQSVGDVP